jgi:tRNA (mo5U34)-methyltransferase
MGLEATEQEQIRAKIASVPYWYHRFEVRPGIVTPGINDTATMLQHLGLPEDCRGKRALDLGTRDGFFAFELTRRGASVLAVDYHARDRTGFAVASELLEIDVPYRQENIYNLDAERDGTFDIVLCLGLLYHLPDPMRALRIVRGLCGGVLYLETQALDNAVLMADGGFATLESISPTLPALPLMQFYPGRALNNDPTNYWVPNMACMRGMLAENNFQVMSESLVGGRATFVCTPVQNAEREYLSAIAAGSLAPR